MSNRKMLYGAILMVAIVVIASGCSPASDATSAATAPSRTITVVGVGKAAGAPDVAQVTIGVETRDESVQQAVDDNEAQMTKILDAIKSLGIAEKDIRTSSYNVFAEREPQRFAEGEDSDAPVVYRVNNMVAVTVRDLGQIGEVLDQAVAAGANNIYGISFSVDDPSELEAEARASAVADARARAESLAELTDVSVAEVLSVSEVIGGSVPVIERVGLPVAYAASAPIEPGELEVQMNVQVTYAIK